MVCWWLFRAFLRCYNCPAGLSVIRFLLLFIAFILVIKLNSVLLEFSIINHLHCKGNYGATSNNMKLVHWRLVVHGWAVTFDTTRRGQGGAAARPVLLSLYGTECNSPPINAQCTNHCILLCNGLLLCGFNVLTKRLILHTT